MKKKERTKRENEDVAKKVDMYIISCLYLQIHPYPCSSIL